MNIREILVAGLIAGTGAAEAVAQEVEEAEEAAEDVGTLDVGTLDVGTEDVGTEAPEPDGGLTIYTGGEIELTFPQDGATQELSAYLEAERNGLYGGVLARITNEAESDEVQLSFGYRAETDQGFSYDLSYSRFFHPNAGGDCCGELALELGQRLDDRLSLTGAVTYDPEAALGSLTVGAEYQASEAIALSANFGLVEEAGSGTEQEWDAGIIWGLSEQSALDVRYFDGSAQDGYLGLSLTFDTTILGG